MFFSSYSRSKEKSNSNSNRNEDEFDLQNASEDERRALLEMACEYDRVDILQSLLQSPASVVQKDEGDMAEIPSSPEATGSRVNRSATNLDLTLLNCPPKHLRLRLIDGTDSGGKTNGDHHTSQRENHEGEESLSDHESVDDEEYSEEGYDSGEDDDEQQEPQPPQFFVPPLHIAVASGSTHATTALLRMGADPSVIPIFPPNISTSELGPMAKYKRCRGAYDLLTVHQPNNLSPSVVQKLKHAFTAEALRAIGSDEEERIQQLLRGGMPPTEKVGDLSLYQWAVELNAVNCQKLLRVDVDKAEGGDKETIGGVVKEEQEEEGEQQTEERPSATREEPEVVPEVPPSIVSPIKGGRKIAVKSLPRIELLQIQLEEQRSLEVTLSSCFDRLLEESSIYEAVLFTDSETKTFSKAGLVQKVKSLKTSKAQLEMELEFYEMKWKEAQDELAYLERDAYVSAVKPMPKHLGEANDSGRRKSEKEEQADGQLPSPLLTEEEQRNQLETQLSASQTKVRLQLASM